MGFASLDAALRTLHEAEATVKDVVAVRFEEAVKDEDLASIERFFKIFPLINMHEDGLGRFTRYLCSKVAAAAADNLKQAGDTAAGDRRADVVFADAVTLLFEGIARTIEIHQPLIETYYGPGRLLTVVQMLQAECDKQAKKIFELFRKRRGVAEKVERVREALVSSASSMSSLASSANLAAAAQQKNKKMVVAKDLDHVLSEMTLLQARAELYYKFIRKRLTVLFI